MMKQAQDQGQVVSQAEFARMLGVSRPYICKLVKRGTIHLTPEGKVVAEEAAAAIGKQVGPQVSGPGTKALAPAELGSDKDNCEKRQRQNNDAKGAGTGFVEVGNEAERQANGKQTTNKGQCASGGIMSPPALPPGGGGQGMLDLPEMDFMQARTISEQFKGLLGHLKYQQEIGALVEAAQVRHDAFEAARRTRDALLAIGERVAPVLAAEKDAAKILEILTREIRQACEELANGLEFISRSGVQEPRPGSVPDGVQ